MAQVTIIVNGHSYVIGCEDGQEKRVAERGREVDAQVRQLAKDVGQLGETRLMLKSALVMADDLAELREQTQNLTTELAEARAEKGRTELTAVAALEGAAARIERLAVD